MFSGMSNFMLLTFLLGLQWKFITFCCYVCLGNDRIKSLHYKKKGCLFMFCHIIEAHHSVKKTALVERRKALQPALHI